MRKTVKQRWEAVICLLFCLTFAQIENVDAAVSGELPSRAEIRSLLQTLDPADREAKIHGLRAEYGSVGPAYGAGRERMGGMSQEARERMARFQREIQNLPPNEREARINEMRRQASGGMPGRTRERSEEIDFSQLSPAQRMEFLKLRRELSGLTTEERRTKIIEFLRKAGIEPTKIDSSSGDRIGQSSVNKLNDADQRRRFQQMRDQARERIAVLEKKKADGSISEQEEKLLQRMKRYGQERRPGTDSKSPRSRRP